MLLLIAGGLLVEASKSPKNYTSFSHHFLYVCSFSQCVSRMCFIIQINLSLFIFYIVYKGKQKINFVLLTCGVSTLLVSAHVGGASERSRLPSMLPSLARCFSKCRMR